MSLSKTLKYVNIRKQNIFLKYVAVFFKDFLIWDSTGDIGPGFTNSLYSHLCNYRRVTHNESLDKCNAIWACIDKYGWY